MVDKANEDLKHITWENTALKVMEVYESIIP
jgi:hypothetical protein